MCLCFFGMVFYLIKYKLSFLPDPPNLTSTVAVSHTQYEKITVEKVKPSGAFSKETFYPVHEHKRWCGASEEAILSVLRFQKERARIRARQQLEREAREAREEDKGLESDEETLVDVDSDSK